MKKLVPIILTVLIAAMAAALAVMLFGGLLTQFSPKPTEFENSVWVSDDKAFVLTVWEYDPDALQCRAELTYHGAEGDITYAVADAPYGAMSVYLNDTEADRWLRVKCDSGGFTVRINRTAELAYASEYEQGEKISFKRGEYPDAN